MDLEISQKLFRTKSGKKGRRISGVMGYVHHPCGNGFMGCFIECVCVRIADIY